VGKLALTNKLVLAGLGCAIHKFNLSLKAGEKASPEVTQAVAHMKAFVSYCHTSPQGMAEYERYCKEFKTPGGKPVQSTEIRFNSLCGLIESVAPNRLAAEETRQWARRVKGKKDVENMDLGPYWSIYDGILPTLKKVRNVSRSFEGDTYPTASRAAAAVRILLAFIRKEAARHGALDAEAKRELEAKGQRHIPGPVVKFLQGVQTDLEKRFSKWDDVVLAAMLLDPAIRDHGMTVDESQRAWTFLEAQFNGLSGADAKAAAPAAGAAGPGAEVKATAAVAGPAAAGPALELDAETLALQELYGMELTQAGPAAPHPDGEFERYRRLPREKLAEKSPLPWWSQRKGEFPLLARLARKFLAIQISSASVERLFSDGGNVVTKKRCSLASDTLEDLVLVKANRELLKHWLTR